MIIVWGALVVSVILNVILIYTSVISVGKEEKLEEYIDEQQAHIEEQDNYVEGLKTSLQEILNKMRELDQRQMFEKDDAVGIIFSMMVEMINMLEVYLDTGEMPSGETTKEEEPRE